MRDPAARTRLGRQRSLLALAVVAALLVHAGTVVGVAGGFVLAAFAALGWGRRSSPTALAAVAVLAGALAAAVTAGL